MKLKKLFSLLAPVFAGGAGGHLLLPFQTLKWMPLYVELYSLSQPRKYTSILLIINIQLLNWSVLSYFYSYILAAVMFITNCNSF